MGPFPEYRQEQPPLPRQLVEEDDEWPSGCRMYIGLFLVIYVLVMVIMWIHRPDADGVKVIPPEYFAAITGVSGLDPSTDLGRRPALDLAFSLTVRVASRSSSRGACVAAGTEVLVYYRGIPLAGGRVPDEVCSEPMGAAADGAVVARGSGVRLPGPELDSLAEDMRRGEALFEVTLTLPFAGLQQKVVSCWDRIGDDAALGVPCELSVVDPRRLAGASAVGRGHGGPAERTSIK
ncbi:hypothetical protein ABZP36_024118 [Zizania latifolia]